MECPVCEGTRFFGQYWYSSKYTEGHYRKKKCNHCDGTGEIQAGDWWMCEVGLTGKEMVMLYRPDAGMTWVLGVTYVNKPVTPLYRMEKVK